MAPSAALPCETALQTEPFGRALEARRNDGAICKLRMRDQHAGPCIRGGGGGQRRARKDCASGNRAGKTRWAADMSVTGATGLTDAVVGTTGLDTGLRRLSRYVCWHLSDASDTAAVQRPGLSPQGQSQCQGQQHDETPKAIHRLTHWAPPSRRAVAPSRKPY